MISSREGKDGADARGAGFSDLDTVTNGGSLNASSSALLLYRGEEAIYPRPLLSLLGFTGFAFGRSLGLC